MNYDLTPEQLSIKDNFTKFCSKEIEPRAAMLDEASHEEVAKLIKENIRMMAGIGYLGIGHEEAYGGMNLDLISQAIAGEAVASACAAAAFTTNCTPPALRLRVTPWPSMPAPPMSF